MVWIEKTESVVIITSKIQMYFKKMSTAELQSIFLSPSLSWAMSLAFYSWAPVTGRRVLHNGEELSPEETGLDFFLLCSGEFPVLLSFATVNSRLRLLCICLFVFISNSFPRDSRTPCMGVIGPNLEFLRAKEFIFIHTKDISFIPSCDKLNAAEYTDEAQHVIVNQSCL